MSEMTQGSSVENIAEARMSNAARKILESWEACTDDFIFAKPPEKQRYLVDGLIPRAKLSVVAGAGAIRKTQMLLELMISSAYPRPDVNETWLGATVLGDGMVLYLSAEEDQEDFHERMHDLGAADRRRAYFGGADGTSRCRPLDKMMTGPLFRLEHGNVVRTDHFAALRALAIRTRPAMIVIDTANSLCPVDFDKTTAHAQSVCSALGIIASESGAAVILVHHITKGGEIANRAAARAAVKGTTGIVDGARNVIVFWDAPQKKGELAVRAGIVDDPANVFMASVVKANGKGADMRERYVTPTGEGAVLSDITARMSAAEITHKEEPGSKSGPKPVVTGKRGRPTKAEMAARAAASAPAKDCPF